jgi:hypothetical protein
MNIILDMNCKTFNITSILDMNCKKKKRLIPFKFGAQPEDSRITETRSMQSNTIWIKLACCVSLLLN